MLYKLSGQQGDNHMQKPRLEDYISPTMRTLPKGAKCTRCRQQATIALPSHHANFCQNCFLHFFETAVLRALKHFPISKQTPLAVAVSGGKDSLALWDILHRLGYKTHGLFLDLGIPEFSETSHEAVDNFASEKGLTWSLYSLKKEFGFSLPEIRARIRGKICAYCGRLKRHFLNRLAIRHGIKTLATGHNLDDEAGRLLGNLLGQRMEYVHKQSPYLPSPHPQIPAKIKPLYRTDILEIVTYCRIMDIKPFSGICPFSRGATSKTMKRALTLIESDMPGTKRSFLFSYIRQATLGKDQSLFGICKYCGQPAYDDLCSVCRLKQRISNRQYHDR